MTFPPVLFPLLLLKALTIAIAASGADVGPGKSLGLFSQLPGCHIEIESSLAADTLLFPDRDDITFTVTVTDTAGHPVTLRLLNPPPGLVFHPFREGTSPHTSTLRWDPPSEFVGRHELLFEAEHDLPPAPISIASCKARLAIPYRLANARQFQFLSNIVTIRGSSSILHGDVTGDGVLDVVAGAVAAQGLGPESGAIYVYAGGQGLTASSAPSATLTVPTGRGFDWLGSGNLDLADITGDGVLDVVVGAAFANVNGIVDSGAIHVFEGGSGMNGAVAPLVTFADPNADANEEMGFGLTLSNQIADVTGDGVCDVITRLDQANVGGVADAGLIHVFNGGSANMGTVAPSATLTVPGASADDMLGLVESGQGVRLIDVNEDGVLDIVAGSSFADAGGIVDSGAVHVFLGGPALSGSISPDATLSVPSAPQFERLGYTSREDHGFSIVDVTGDGKTDVVIHAMRGGSGTASAGGVIYVFSDSAGVTGLVSPIAQLTHPDPSTEDELGSKGIRFEDVTGDGVLDILAGTQNSHLGSLANMGGIYVFAGGPGLSGSPSPTASLRVQDSASNLFLSQSGFYLADFTGDGVLDVVTSAPNIDIGGVKDVGAIYLFAGGAGMTGSPSPAATLTDPGALAFARMQIIAVADVSNDGIPDILGFGDEFFLFAGTPAGLSGAVQPTADFPFGSLHLADVTGDKKIDVVVGATSKAVGGVFAAGAVDVYSLDSGSTGTLTPLATLAAPNPSGSDQLGRMNGESVQFADINADGILDVLVGGDLVDDGPTEDVGGLFAFAGGASLTGMPAPIVSLRGSFEDDHLTRASGQGFGLADVTGDGIVDILAGMANGDIAGVVDAGAIYFVKGKKNLAGVTGPTTILTVPGAATGDGLGH